MDTAYRDFFLIGDEVIAHMVVSFWDQTDGNMGFDLSEPTFRGGDFFESFCSANAV